MTGGSHDEVVAATEAAEDTMRPQSVPVNAWLAPEAMVIVAPLPAVQAGDIQVELHEGEVRFWAHLRSSGPREYLLDEWEYGGYERTVEIPEGFGADVEAGYANGQLTIRVLKGAFSQTRKIHPEAL